MTFMVSRIFNNKKNSITILINGEIINLKVMKKETEKSIKERINKIISERNLDNIYKVL